MDRLSLRLIVTAVALLQGSAAPMAQQFEYTPYRGSNNTGQPSTPPPDDYTPAHPAGAPSGAPAPATAGPASGYQGAARQGGASDAYSPSNQPPSANSRDATTPSDDAFPPPAARAAPPAGGTYSPSEDVYSPSRAVPQPPLSPSSPPRGVGGPPPRDFGVDLPRVEVQAAAPDDGVPFSVREHDSRRAAIDGWRNKVSGRFGREFSGWRAALAKRVECRPDRGNGVVCTASAQPARGADRYGDGPRDDGD
jgi:hypothetical protein